MTEILMYSKETDNKYRWDVDIGETKFELYIPKWRVPNPVPQRIKVDLYYPPNLPNVYHLSCELALTDPDLCKLPIIAEVCHHSGLTQTVRFDPIDQKEPELGSPYIPFQLIPDGHIERIVICVQWS